MKNFLKRFIFLTLVTILFSATTAKSDDGIVKDLCTETCNQKQSTENESVCQAAYNSCSGACPSGFAGKMCLVPCKSTNKSCVDKINKENINCLAKCSKDKTSTDTADKKKK